MNNEDLLAEAVPALARGELDPERTEKLRRAIADDPDLRKDLVDDLLCYQQIDQQLDAQRKVAEKVGAGASEPGPESEARARPVVDRRMLFRPLLLAAGLVLGIALAVALLSDGESEMAPSETVAEQDEQATEQTEQTVEPTQGGPAEQDGGAWLIAADGTRRRLQPGAALAAGAVVELDTGTQRVRLGDRADLELRGSTRLEVPEDHGPIAALLRRGHSRVAVEPRESDEPFAIGTPQGQVEVLGTTFTLEVNDYRTRCAVEEGRVRCTDAAGEARELAAGEATAWAAEHVLRFFDFEDAARQPWKQGSVVRRPDGLGHAMQGEVTASTPVAFLRPAHLPPVFRYQRGLHLRFQVWVEGADQLRFQSWHSATNDNVGFNVAVEPGGWREVEIDLGAMAHNDSSISRPVRVGDRFHGLAFLPARGHFTRLLIDDIRFVLSE